MLRNENISLDAEIFVSPPAETGEFLSFFHPIGAFLSIFLAILLCCIDILRSFVALPPLSSGPSQKLNQKIARRFLFPQVFFRIMIFIMVMSNQGSFSLCVLFEPHNLFIPNLAFLWQMCLQGIYASL